jgi:hypothetical protein
MSSQHVGLSVPFVSGERAAARRDSRGHNPMHGGWSVKVGEVRGIDLYVHGTFLILLAWIALSHPPGTSSEAVRRAPPPTGAVPALP